LTTLISDFLSIVPFRRKEGSWIHAVDKSRRKDT
jgi:hypothetical protein